MSSTSVSGSALLLLPLAALSNINCLQGEFVFDDSEAVAHNPDVVGGAHWLDLLRDDFWGTPLHKESSHGSFRPVITSCFRLMWQSGLTKAGWFRLLNLITHCAVTLKLHSVLREALWFQYDPLQRHAHRVAFIAAALFAIHPVHVESLCSAVGLADLLCALFFLNGFRTYIRWISEPESRAAPIQLVLYAALAFFSKEPGVTVLGVCGAYEILVNCDIIPHHAITKHKGFVNSFKKNSIFRFAFCAVCGAVLIFLRCLIANFKMPTFLPMDNPASFLDSPLARAVNYQYVYALNVLLLVWPQWLCFDWSMGCVPIVHSPLDPRLVALPVLWLFLASLVKAASTDNLPRRWYCIAVSLLVIPFIPCSNIFVRVGFVVAERNLYIPSMGFCLLLSVVAMQCCKKVQQHRKLIGAMSVALLFLMTARSMRRSRDWRNEHDLFHAGLNVCPLNAKVHYNIAKVASDRDAAIASYRQAIELNPLYEQAMNNLANILKDVNQLDEAKRLLEKAVDIRPSFAAAWMNLGIVEAALKNFTRAELCYRTAIRHRNYRYPHCYFNLGNLYLETRDHARALSAFRTAVSQSPSHVLSWNNMIILLDSLGRLPEAEAAARDALRSARQASSGMGDAQVESSSRRTQRSAAQSVAELEFHLANALGKMDRFEEAEQHFNAAIDIRPGHASYHLNLGVLYHRWGRNELARKEYRKALELNPDSISAKENLNKLDKRETELKKRRRRR